MDQFPSAPQNNPQENNPTPAPQNMPPPQNIPPPPPQEPILFQLGYLTVYQNRVESVLVGKGWTNIEVMPFAQMSHIIFGRISKPDLLIWAACAGCAGLLTIFFANTRPESLVIKEEDVIPVGVIALLIGIGLFIAYFFSKKTYIKFISTGNSSISMMLDYHTPQELMNQLSAIVKERLIKFNS